MTTVTMSPKCQVVIPREASYALGIQLGQKGSGAGLRRPVEFIPARKLSKMRGFLRGIDTKVLRDRV